MAAEFIECGSGARLDLATHLVGWITPRPSVEWCDASNVIVGLGHGVGLVLVAQATQRGISHALQHPPYRLLPLWSLNPGSVAR